MHTDVSFALPDGWFVDLYPSSDIRYNFAAKCPSDSGRWFFPFNFMVGKLLTRSIVASLEIQGAWGDVRSRHAPCA